ncbi:ABC transporter substrate-binding protein [Pararhodobacter zhoushanensis]|uniref:ABC transporter substrate-binding protein n=1 Tax=Pararhodobacter zhoushanensis TaxID=2479545 RepID=A0ABT3GV67_9RHOB|nr:ABC transporter substrate-binding protein [Pararhodobacter zhoushanensis]MCW1931426.1 ABC transporter substrate-binding protein [Pararhodobacter zhoushanensis]
MTIVRPLTGLTALALALALGIVPATRAAQAQATPDNFIVAVAEEPDTLDLTSTSHAPGGRITLENITEGLWRTTTDGEVVPGLASFEASPDGMMITFHLRQDVVFHSGDPFTAEDVVFSHERMTERAPQYARRARNVDHLEIVDPYTVRMVFSRPDAGLLPARGFSIASKAYFDRVGEEEFTRHPVGTGPYEFVSYTPGSNMVLRRFDGYWGDAVQVENATFRFVREASTRLAQLQTGEVGMTMDVPYTDVESLRSAGFGLEFLNAHPTVGIQFQTTNPDVPWHDPRVRQAFAYAIDREAIIGGLLQGVPAVSEAVTEGELGYDPALEFRAYDPAHARQLLADAGYPNGFDMPFYIWGGAFAGLRETAEAVVLYLQQVGINADVQTLEASQFLGMLREVSGSEDGVYVGISAMPWANQSDPIEALTVAFYGRSPFAPYRNADVDTLIAQANTLLDPAERGPVLQQIFALMYEDAALVPLWNFVAVYAQAEGVEFTPTQRWFPVVQLRDVSFD